jgi:hypothetical protein
MSQYSGDIARHNRRRKARNRMRVKMRALKIEIEARKTAAAVEKPKA